MKFFIALILLMTTLSAMSSEASLRTFRFVEAKKVKELSGLPPKLMLTFEIMCNEELIKVIRHDWIEPKSQKVTIAVGALVRENIFSSCAGKKIELRYMVGSIPAEISIFAFRPLC
jgi:hypothetical protein